MKRKLEAGQAAEWSELTCQARGDTSVKRERVRFGINRAQGLPLATTVPPDYNPCGSQLSTQVVRVM